MKDMLIISGGLPAETALQLYGDAGIVGMLDLDPEDDVPKAPKTVALSFNPSLSIRLKPDRGGKRSKRKGEG